jgi:rRNA biogenesis protein RRP5
MFVACRVLEPLPSQPACADVSLRQSRLDGDIDDDEQPEVGELRNAYVIDTNAKGCFIRLSRQTEGRVLLKEICDGFLPDPKSSFPAGRLVVGKIKALQKNKRKGPYKWVVDVDMRESVILAEGKLKFEQIVVGGKFKGVVTRIEDYGVFVRIENSDVFGLVHKSECSDNFVKNLSDLYDPGDLVKVLVLKVDSDKKQLGFSMKASHFEDDEDSDSDASVDSDFMRAENDGSDSSDAQALDSDDDDYVAKLAASSRRRHRSESFDHGASEEDAHSSESEDSDAGESDSSEQDAQKDDKAMMDTDVGFVWDAHASQDSDASKNNDSDGDDDELSSEDDQVHKSSHKSRRKHAQRIREEQEIARREAALADGTANEKPETAADFERLLSGEPNNSELWIKYMAFHMSLADIPAARKVAERAFQRIEFRQEREKMNVWSALLTLELRYGSEKSFQECMDRACKHNNPKYVFLRVCEMLEREAVGSSGESMQRCHDMYMKLTKKFKDKKKAWLAHIEYLLRNNRHEDAHALSKRAMQSLPPHKHFETISRFAQLVFEHGNPERARTLFEGLLLKYSKRLDLFFVYIDKEIKHGDIKHARGLFEKQVVSDSSSGKMKLNDKQMKSFFKKWFSVEEQYGTLATQERVKEAARLYVQQTSIN